MDSAANLSSASRLFPTGQKLCAPFLSLIGLIESLILTFAGCFEHRRQENRQYTFNDILRLANSSPFTVNEIEALREFYKKLSNLIFNDGLIHKEELKLALLNSASVENLFLDRVFDLFDIKKNGVIDFEEFVRALSVFHPCAPMEEKMSFAFRLYDLGETGYIEREEIRKMVVAILLESGVHLSHRSIDAIIEKTFADADADKDGRINREEWRAFVIQRPTLLHNMTLHCLKYLTLINFIRGFFSSSLKFNKINEEIDHIVTLPGYLCGVHCESQSTVTKK